MASKGKIARSKKAWTAPKLQRLHAGAAENNPVRAVIPDGNLDWAS